MLILWLSFLVAALDQATKYLVQERFHLGAFVEIVPRVLDFHYIRNTGAAWGMFSGFSHWLVAVSLVMLVVLVVFRRSIMTDSLVHRFATGLMIGGIVGNLIDRVRLGYVVDFVDFYWLDRTTMRHFPAFNVADSAICIGVGLYILTQIKLSGKQEAVPQEVERSKDAPSPNTVPVGDE